ncbi:4Fe-4S dicluster domain-containing protein [Neobacillus sp. Marseille-QA0830]
MSLLTKWLESMHVDMEFTPKCSRFRNLRSSCRFCFDACKTGAISIEQQEIRIQIDKCNNCGDCMVSCPLSAIEGISRVRTFENGSLQYNNQYAISEKELLIYNEKGIHSVTSSDFPLSEQWNTAIEGANQILALLEKGPITVLTRPDGEKLSRRELFSSLIEQGRHLGKELSPAAWRIAPGEWILTNYFPDDQFYTVQIDKEKCNLCQACFHLCTQNVFLLENSTLRINHGNCVNCKDCTDICPESAIQINLDIKKKAISQSPVAYHTCQNCGTNFTSSHDNQQECHVCKARDPEWLSPLG